MEIKGTNWSILPDRASFKNISVSGEIETAVFKNNSIQAAGGVMVFRPSYKIETIEKDEITGDVIVTFLEEVPDASGHTLMFSGGGSS